MLGVLADVALFGLIVLLASQSINDFQEKIPRYAIRLTGMWNGWIEGLQAAEFPGAVMLASYLRPELVDPGRFFTLAGGTLATVFSFASNAFLVFLILIFILGEATVFPAKFRAILGRTHGHSSRLTKIVAEVQEYLGIKTFISLATGYLLGAWCWVLDLDFPILLGLVAFVLNYVPTIGSIIASAPAMLLGLIQFGVGHALVVSVGYIVVNMAFGNLIEPNLLGRRLGLSTLVVILSLIFWGWVWGAGGGPPGGAPDHGGEDHAGEHFGPEVGIHPPGQGSPGASGGAGRRRGGSGGLDPSPRRIHAPHSLFRTSVRFTPMGYFRRSDPFPPRRRRGCWPGPMLSWGSGPPTGLR